MEGHSNQKTKSEKKLGWNFGHSEQYFSTRLVLGIISAVASSTYAKYIQKLDHSKAGNSESEETIPLSSLTFYQAK